MTKRPDKDSSQCPDSDAMRSGASPAEASQYLRFALTQLSGENGHHKFELLCFQLTRRRIYPNVIPATGPVSAGGDQGADFETYHVGEETPFAPKSDFFGRVAREKVLFACSLQTGLEGKIKADLRAASLYPEKVERLAFFSSRDLPVGRRHKLQGLALKKYGIALEVFDAHAIADLLTEPELFWIAQTYLGIPSEFALALPKSNYSWYEEARQTEVDPACLLTSDFFKLKSALRHATHEQSHRSDLPNLLTKIRAFRGHRSASIRRKAFYEDFVASLRGLEQVRGFESDLEKYLSEIALSYDPNELQDASVLLTYSVGAAARGLLDVGFDAVRRWRRLLIDRIDSLLCEKGMSKGRRCSLLSTKGSLLLFDWIEGTPLPSGGGKPADLDATRAIAVWKVMIKDVRHAPMFPVESFSKRLSLLAGYLGHDRDFEGLVADTDKLVAARFGQQKLAEQAFERAKSYAGAGKPLEAIDAMHKAHIGSFIEETSEHSVRLSLFLAKMYSDIGLHFAAKCYALAAAFAAVKLDDDSVRGLAYRGITEAASSDYASGASMEFFLTAKVFFFLLGEFPMAGNEEVRQLEWARIDFYSLVLTRAAVYINEPLHKYLKETVLRAFGTEEIYEESSLRLHGFFGTNGFQGMVEKAINEGVMPPFSDVGGTRRVGWQQLGVRWFVEWPIEYQTGQKAEGLCASLQILLLDLRDAELSILPSDVHIEVRLHEGALEIRDLSDNARVSLSVLLPTNGGASGDAADYSVTAQAVAVSALASVSAMPTKDFKTVYENRLRVGLIGKLSPYAGYDRLFREFYSEEEFTQHYRHSSGIGLHLPASTMKTHEGLAAPNGTHPQYDAGQSHRIIRKRYKLLSGQLKFVLPELLKNAGFLAAVRELRKVGWKDWHILQAAASIRLNFIVDATVQKGAPLDELGQAAKHIFEREGQESDPCPPISLFTSGGMRQALRMTQLSTLKGLGFQCPQRTPNFVGLDKLLQRFHYWSDDVPHAKIFED